MADILRYGAYLPKHRTPLGELQSFYGRPGRPRSRTLATPGLDEDTLTMAYEAATEALAGERAPAALISVSMSAPFGLRKMSATLSRALGLAADTVPYDLGGHPGGLMDAFATCVSLALQYGVPLQALCDKFAHMRFEPSGFTGNPEIPIAKSIMDYIFRWLDLRFGNGAASHEPAEEEAFEAPKAAPRLATPDHRTLERSVFTSQADAPPCHVCSSIMVRNGSCYKCLNCGVTSGCS